MILEEILENNQPNHQYGYKQKEISDLINLVKTHHPSFNTLKFENAMFGNTCMIDESDKQIVYYPWDVKKALQCGIENRNLTVGEWD